MPTAMRGAIALSSKPSSVLMTALALFMSPSQKNSSRAALSCAMWVLA
jgi:hypothetical protein